MITNNMVKKLSNTN